MVRSTSASKIQTLELDLEEALQMLRLVAMNKRTCFEVQEWLDNNHPLTHADRETLNLLNSIRPSSSQVDKK